MVSAGAHAPVLLLVDDDLALLEGVRHVLADGGYDVIACGSFEEAKRELVTRRPDVLVTDVRLGEYNGLQLALTARDMYPDVRLFVFSGFDDPVLRHDAQRIGATYLVKPLSGDALLQQIRSTAEPMK